MKTLTFVSLIMMFITSCFHQKQTKSNETSFITPAGYHSQKATNKLFVIEREMLGVGDLTSEQLAEASGASNKVISELDPEIKWIHSYVAGDKIYCVYSSPSKELIKKHAELAGFPANVVTEVDAIIDPSTAVEAKK